MQSCYLFDCGSPAKPLCKFTSHILFTSSILKMSHHSYELSQWGKQVQLERKTVESTSTTTSTTTPAPSSTVKANACHHYQFQCVNSSECIAIYNVCDGIPQCPDGSDESTDIKCPLKAGMAPNKVSPPDKVSPPIDNPRPPLNALYPPAFQNVLQKPLQAEQQSDYGWPPFSGLQMPKTRYPAEGPSPFVHKHSQFISAADPHVQNLNRWATDYSDAYARPPMQYESDYDTRPEDLDTSYTAADEFSQSQKMLGYPVKDYARTDEEDQYPEAKIGMRKLPMQEDYKMQRYGPSHHVHSQHQETKSYSEDLIKLPKTSGHSSLVHHSATKAPEKVKAKSLQRTVLDFKMSVAEVYESSHSHSHEANSAILALVLGITVSILLALLLVCRLKTLGRLSSRKGRVLAHDADYLVNGMYL